MKLRELLQRKKTRIRDKPSAKPSSQSNSEVHSMRSEKLQDLISRNQSQIQIKLQSIKQ